MVMADGSIVDIRRGERCLRRGDNIVTISGATLRFPLPSYGMPDVKNSSGYYAKEGMDLIDLFIGQEGTLSVIVEVELGLVSRPEKILSSFVFFGAEEAAWRFASDASGLSRMNRAGPDNDGIDALSIEYFDSNALELLRSRDVSIPVSARAAVFFEQETRKGAMEEAVLDKWLNLISGHGVDTDNTWVAMNEKDAGRFTAFRYAIPESINEIIRRDGFRKFSTDIAVPDGSLIEMMRFYADNLRRANARHVIFGHIGENHLHVNILPRTEAEVGLAGDLALKFVRKGVALGGAVSAEHGIGKIKHRYLNEMYGTSGVMEMSKLKRALDPNCILGLDNIFPKSILSELP